MSAAPTSPPASRRDAAIVAALALAARLAVVAWAAPRIPPAADGLYYAPIAERIARGLGYTWLWPDGAVTYAAHYPVGYPALVAAAYVVFGARPVVAMLLNAVIGAAGALAVHRLARRAASPRLALASGLLVALHPGLVAYTPALMTEGVTASLVACAAAVAAWARERAAGGRGYGVLPALAIGAVVGVATLVRPQSLVLAPALGLLAAALPARPFLRRGATMAVAATLAALVVCAPWTARNCVRMKRCALVSVNGGWNLLIGADAASTGAWSQIKVPDACREVWDEAEKDACFGREAQRYVREHPLAWLALAPKKLAATFDYAGAAGWYLHEANAEAFPYGAKVALGAVETVFERVMLVLALLWAARGVPRPSRGAPRPAAWSRWLCLGAAALGTALALGLHAWLAYAALAVVALSQGRRLWTGPMLGAAAIVVVVVTMATHAVFFGAGRYSLVVLPLVTALAPLAFARRPQP